MKKNTFSTTILLIFIWLIGLMAIIKGLDVGDIIIPILGITAPYYLTKYLLVNEENEREE